MFSLCTSPNDWKRREKKMMFIRFALLMLVATVALASSQESQDTDDPNVWFVNVTFSNPVGEATLLVNNSWSPLGARRFRELVDSGYFDENAIFRVVPNFVCQWGINSVPSVSAYWGARQIENDKTPNSVSNSRGTVAFAAEYTEVNGVQTTCCRTTQLFFNYVDNAHLDAMGFTPFARAADVASMHAFDAVYAGYGQQPNQTLIYEDGAAYLQQNFPLLTSIHRMARVP
jgi:peptidyl-prolyl cis-trans isomerase A (cyclophilin A)